LIFRNLHSTNYTLIANGILRNKEMSFKAKGLLCYMLSCTDNWNFSIEGIASMAKDGKESVNSGLNELIDLGYLDRYPLRDKISNQIRNWVYDIYEDPTVPKKRTTFEEWEQQLKGNQ